MLWLKRQHNLFAVESERAPLQENLVDNVIKLTRYIEVEAEKTGTEHIINM